MQEINKMNEAQLQEKLVALRAEAGELNQQAAALKLSNVRSLRVVKKDIARVLTALTALKNQSTTQS